MHINYLYVFIIAWCIAVISFISAAYLNHGIITALNTLGVWSGISALISLMIHITERIFADD